MSSRGTDALASTLSDLRSAVARGDRGAVETQTAVLARLTSGLTGFWRARGLDEHEVDEARQELLVKLYLHAEEHPSVALRDGSAWVFTVATNVANDVRRSHARRRADAQRATREALEDSGVHATRDLFLRLEADARIERAIERLTEALQHYLNRATVIRPLGRVQLEAWVLLRLERINGAEAAARLGVADRANGGIDTVHQWVKRGDELLARLIEEDRNVARRELMRGIREAMR